MSQVMEAAVAWGIPAVKLSEIINQPLKASQLAAHSLIFVSCEQLSCVELVIDYMKSKETLKNGF